MTTSLSVPFLLPEDLLVIPVTDLAAESRERLEASDDDFAITRPRSRKPSSVVDRDSAELIQRFRSARTIVEAVVDFSRTREIDPHSVLTGALPMLQRLIAARLLVPAEDGLARPVIHTFETGDFVGSFEIVYRTSVLFDVELYQARATDGTLCLLKVARAEGGARIVRSLTGEAAMLERLAGVDVPRLVELGDRDGLPYLAIEWQSGTHPTRAAAEFRPADNARSRRALLDMCIRIAGAYARLHERQVAHGDVHDQNVLIGRDGRVTLVDFGQPYLLDGSAPHQQARGGVLSHHDPEMAAALLADRNVPPATALSEQYAIGTLLYEVVTGDSYLDLAVRREAALQQIVAEPPRSFESRGTPEWLELESVLQRMLAKNPVDRFPSMEAVVAALESIQAPSVVESSPVTSRSERIARQILDRVRLDGPLYRSRLPEAPHCSVNNGAAGIAHAWYRLALLREDADALSTATAWIRRAAEWSTSDEAFFLDDETISPQTVGRAGLFHSRTGVECVRALIAHAEGDDAEARRAFDDFARAARVRCSRWDLTLGRAGALLGCALQFEADPNPTPNKSLGDRLASALTTRLAKFGPILSSSKVETLSIAHGWAGGVYALLRWSQATGAAIHSSVVDRIEELAAYGWHSGRGIAWPRFPDRRDAALESTWCNGDAGMAFLWLLVAETLQSERFVDLAEGAAWMVADRGPDRMADLCCGSGGRAYAFLALFRRTGDEIWLRRAKRFAEHALRDLDPDASDAHRLYKGALGVALLFNELDEPLGARMPLFESEGWRWRHQRR
jgi:serine/threonine-protein kinase